MNVFIHIWLYLQPVLQLATLFFHIISILVQAFVSPSINLGTDEILLLYLLNNPRILILLDPRIFECFVKAFSLEIWNNFQYIIIIVTDQVEFCRKIDSNQ